MFVGKSYFNIGESVFVGHVQPVLTCFNLLLYPNKMARWFCTWLKFIRFPSQKTVHLHLVEKPLSNIFWLGAPQKIIQYSTSIWMLLMNTHLVDDFKPFEQMWVMFFYKIIPNWLKRNEKEQLCQQSHQPASRHSSCSCDLTLWADPFKPPLQRYE